MEAVMLRYSCQANIQPPALCDVLHTLTQQKQSACQESVQNRLCMQESEPVDNVAGVDSTGRIESFFDAISYQKGGSVIRMLRAFLNNQRVADEQYGLRRSLLRVITDLIPSPLPPSPHPLLPPPCSCLCVPFS